MLGLHFAFCDFKPKCQHQSPICEIPDEHYINCETLLHAFLSAKLSEAFTCTVYNTQKRTTANMNTRMWTAETGWGEAQRATTPKPEDHKQSNI